MMPVRGYFTTAMLIAAMAFGLGQVVPGLGMLFVMIATFVWTACNSQRTRAIKVQSD